MLLWQLTHLSHWAQVDLLRLSWPRQRAFQPNPNIILWNKYEQASNERFKHQKGKRFLQGSGVLTRYMYRNILSVTMIYTTYDPKPHPPGINIRAVIHVSFQNHYQIFSNEIKRDTPQKLTPSRRLMRFATQFVCKIWRFWDSSSLLKKTLGPEACRALRKLTPRPWGLSSFA